MIILLGRRLYRLILLVLLVLLLLPALHFYALKALNPGYVHFQEPRGQAIKVSAEAAEDERESRSAYSRFLYFLHEFYQNGL